MGLYDEPYDISYLHEREGGNESQKEDKNLIPEVLRKKSSIAIVCIVIVFIGTSLLILNLGRSQDTKTNANEVGEAKEITVDATVVCEKNSESERCKRSLITDDGKKYSIDESVITVSELKEGEKVKVEGVVQNTGDTPLIVVKKTTPITIPFYKTPTPPIDPNLTPTPTVAQGHPIAPTPTPQVLKNNTPSPGTEYQTITYVIQNKNSLNGQTINVKGYLVGGYIGREGCDFESDCNHSQFILSDYNSPNRDTSFDILYIGGTDDKEGDYAPGQDFYSTVKVILDGETVYLEKIK